MHIVVISSDKNILDRSSPAFSRMLKYAELVSHLSIICYTPHQEAPWDEGNISMYPAFSIHKFLFPFLVLKTLGKIKQTNIFPKETVIVSQDPFEMGLTAYVAKIFFGYPISIQDHGNFFESSYWKKMHFLNPLRILVGKYILQKADSIRTVSLREKNYLTNELHISPEKIFNFPVYTDFKKIIPLAPIKSLKEEFPGYTFYILWMGRIEKEKNVPLLLKAFQLFLKEVPSAALILIGSGTECQKMKKLAKALEIDKSTFFKTWTSNPFDYYKTADVFVLPSFSEGWSLAVIEASASECPVIMTDTGCAREFLIDQKSGWVVSIDSVMNLNQTLIEAYNSPEKRSSFTTESLKNLNNLPSAEETYSLTVASWQHALK